MFFSQFNNKRAGFAFPIALGIIIFSILFFDKHSKFEKFPYLELAARTIYQIKIKKNQTITDTTQVYLAQKSWYRSTSNNFALYFLKTNSLIFDLSYQYNKIMLYQPQISFFEPYDSSNQIYSFSLMPPDIEKKGNGFRWYDKHIGLIHEASFSKNKDTLIIESFLDNQSLSLITNSLIKVERDSLKRKQYHQIIKNSRRDYYLKNKGWIKTSLPQGITYQLMAKKRMNIFTYFFKSLRRKNNSIK